MSKKKVKKDLSAYDEDKLYCFASILAYTTTQ